MGADFVVDVGDNLASAEKAAQFGQAASETHDHAPFHKGPGKSG
jgi:hypothetical protein